MRPWVSVSGTRCTRCVPDFKFQPREDAASCDLGDDLLVASRCSLARRQNLDTPAFQLGIALIHPEQIAGKNRRLVAAGPRAYFENGIFLVGGILRQKCNLQILFEFEKPGADRPQLFLGKAAQLRLGRGIGQHGFEFRRLHRLARENPGWPW